MKPLSFATRPPLALSLLTVASLVLSNCVKIPTLNDAGSDVTEDIGDAGMDTGNPNQTADGDGSTGANADADAQNPSTGADGDDGANGDGATSDGANGDGFNGDAPDTFVMDSGVCAGMGLMVCGGSCVNTQSNAMHCGACGNACPGAMSCISGECRCAGTQVVCGGSCVDTQANNTHCGRCGNACPAGINCVGGVCACPGMGQVACGGSCVSTQSNNMHCGMCNNACAGGQVCTGGSCQCPAASPQMCGGMCVNTTTDNNNCGACGMACGAGRVCIAGSCQCLAALTMCGASCVDTAVDNNNCGGCGVMCSAVQHCEGGSCACPARQADCLNNGTCIDLSSDRNNCGGCRRVCPTPPNTVASCGAGACSTQCLAGFADCDGMAANGCEVDLNSASNCGACGNVCAGQCVAGVCTEWLRRVGEAANISNETGWDSAEDRAGNVYFTGSFDNQTNFGAGPVSGTMGTGFVVSYTPRGVVRWVRTFDSAGYDEARTVTVRTVAGRVKVLVAGNASGSLNLGGNVVGGGVSTFFIVEYDDAGALQWSTVMQAQRNPFGAIIDSAMSASGDVYITGGTTTFTIEGNTIQNAIFANNGTTAFVMKLNPMGVHQWTRWIGAPLVDSAGRAVALDSANNMVVAVEGHDVMDAGGGPRGFMGSSFDMLLAKYDSNNVHQWSTVFNDSGISLLSTVAINQFNDEITIAGHHSGSVDFGGAMVGAPPPASYNTFVVNIAANGNAGRPVATLARSYITNTVHAAAYPTLAYTSDSRLFLSDSYSGVPMIGGVAVAPGAGLREYIAEIDTGTLNLTSVMNFTGTNTNETHSITGCGAGFVCTTGGFRPNVSFGMATVSAAPGLSNYDVYFARIARP